MLGGLISIVSCVAGLWVGNQRLQIVESAFVASATLPIFDGLLGPLSSDVACWLGTAAGTAERDGGPDLSGIPRLKPGFQPRFAPRSRAVPPELSCRQVLW